MNGPGQLDKIRSFNQLAASVATLRREREGKAEKSREQKKKEEEDKAAKKLEKERETEEKRQEAQAHFEKGFDHVNSLKIKEKIQVLKYVFDRVEAKSTLRMQRANIILHELFHSKASVEESECGIDEQSENAGTIDVLASVPLPVLAVPLADAMPNSSNESTSINDCDVA